MFKFMGYGTNNEPKYQNTQFKIEKILLNEKYIYKFKLIFLA